MGDRAGKRRGPSGPDASRPVYVISVAAELVSVHPRTRRIYEGEGLVCPARTPTRIRHLTQNLGVNLAGVRVLFELEERLGMRLLELLYSEPKAVAKRDGNTPDKAVDESSGAEPRTPNPDRTAKEI